MSETKLWEGRPSQWVNFTHWLLLVVTFGFWAPVAAWNWLAARCTEYVLSNQRLITRRGILSRTEDEIELFRVKDTRLDQPFLLRVVGLANIELVSSDAMQKNQVIRAIPNARELREMLRSAVDARREAKGVREVDYAR